MVDLHIHSNYSDGTDSVVEILEHIRDKGIKTFSITDHDIIDGNFEVLKLLDNADNRDIPKFITGVEVSSIFNGTEMHLLGYGFDVNNAQVKTMLDTAKENRRKKVLYMLDYLKDNYDIVFSAVQNDWLMSLKLVGKPHVAKVMIDNGYGKDVGEVIVKYLDKCKAPNLKTDAKYMIDCIHNGGGFVSLAHPKEIMRDYTWDFGKIDDIVAKLKSIGLDAVEVYHSSQNCTEIAEYKKIADKYNLLISGGSDYHGVVKKGVYLGIINAESSSVTKEQLTILKKLLV